MVWWYAVAARLQRTENQPQAVSVKCFRAEKRAVESNSLVSDSSTVRFSFSNMVGGMSAVDVSGIVRAKSLLSCPFESKTI